MSLDIKEIRQRKYDLEVSLAESIGTMVEEFESGAGVDLSSVTITWSDNYSSEYGFERIYHVKTVVDL